MESQPAASNDADGPAPGDSPLPTAAKLDEGSLQSAADRRAADVAGLYPAPLPSESLEVTPQGDFADWLQATRGAVAFTTYNSGKLVFVTASARGLHASCWKLARPMGLAVRGDRLAVVARSGVSTFRRLDAQHGTAFRHEEAFYTGRIDAHDAAWGRLGLYFVNTRFNCIARPSDRSRFKRGWQPKFIPDVVTRDACHLNGLGMRRGAPALVTAFCESAEIKGWKNIDRFTAGVAIDVPRNEVIARGLCMPHSPRRHGGRWWLCNSGAGTLCRLDEQSGAVEVAAAAAGFTRGLCFVGKVALVGLSRIRPKHILDAPPLRDRCGSGVAGVEVVDTRTGRSIGRLEISHGGREVYETAFLPEVESVRFDRPALRH